MNAISTPATGLSVFNTTDSAVYIRRGTVGGWSALVNATGTQTIAGQKTFSDVLFIGSGNSIRGTGTGNTNIYIDGNTNLGGAINYRATNHNFTGSSSFQSITGTASTISSANTISLVTGTGATSFRIGNTGSSSIWYFENNRNAPSGSLEITNATNVAGITLFPSRNVNIGSNTEVASAKLNVESTTQGFLQPRMTNTQMNAITSPTTGLSVFNTTDSSHYIYRGTGGGWQRLANTTPGNTETQQTYTSGASVTCNDATTWLIIDPATLQSTLTVNLPSSPSANQDVLISFGGTLTTGVVVNTLTISPTPLQATTPKFIEVGESVGYRWNATNSKWYRVN
jgi:hypothetical protein